jgi:hypothetical protein
MERIGYVDDFGEYWCEKHAQRWLRTSAPIEAEHFDEVDKNDPAVTEEVVCTVCRIPLLKE